MENLIEELTKVNPANLSEEGLKLFNKINEIIDRNRELELTDREKVVIEAYRNIVKKTGQDTGWVICDPKQMWSNYFIPKSKVRELREIDNIDLLQFKIKELLQEGDK